MKASKRVSLQFATRNRQTRGGRKVFVWREKSLNAPSPHWNKVVPLSCCGVLFLQLEDKNVALAKNGAILVESFLEAANDLSLGHEDAGRALEWFSPMHIPSLDWNPVWNQDQENCCSQMSSIWSDWSGAFLQIKIEGKKKIYSPLCIGKTVRNTQKVLVKPWSSIRFLCPTNLEQRSRKLHNSRNNEFL